MTSNRLLPLLGMALGLLAACSAPAPETSAPAPAPAPATTAPVQRPALLAVERRRLFSSATAPDVFRLALPTDSLLSAPALLSITTAAGREIYRQQLPAGSLEASLVYAMSLGEQPTVARREAYVRQQVAEFFAEDNFISPAVSPGARYRAGLVSAAEWRALQQPGTVGFSFTLGKEDGHRLAWLHGRVLRYEGFGG